MKAIVLEAFGGPDELKCRDVPHPEPGSHEVLVHVHAVSINPIDYKIREQGSGFGIELPAILGYDVAGTVEAVGASVTEFVEGDDVFYSPLVNGRGSYAEYHAVPASIVAHKPDNLSHQEAAALPLAGCTAWQALFDRAGLQIDETVLIHGTGGVGLLAVQMARAAGARVLAVGSDYMQDQLPELGADQAINYKEDDVIDAVREATQGTGVDVVFDTVGNDTLARSLEVTAPFGRMVTIVGDSTGVPGGAISKNVSADYLMMQREGATMRSLKTIAERGQVRPLIAETRPLEQAADAHRRLEEGGVPGKIVLLP